MKNKVLSVFQGEKGRRRPPLIISFPEPEAEGSTFISKLGSNGDGWQVSTVSVYGIGRLLHSTQYIIDKAAVTFVSEPSEAVVCLRIYMGENSEFGYQGEQERLELDITDIRIFWQGERITENRMPEGKHGMIEVFFRPECLYHLSDRESISDIIDQSLTKKYVPLDQIVCNGSEHLQIFLDNLIEEIYTKSISVERFHYLCDCLLLICLGEYVEVEPREETEEEISEMEEVVDEKYKPSIEEQEILSELEKTSRAKLLKLIPPLIKEKKELKLEINEKREITKKLNQIINELSLPMYEEIRSKLMNTAYLFAEWHKKDFSDKDKKLLHKGIVISCKMAFQWGRPSIEEMAFYVKWSDKHFVSEEMDIGDLSSFLSQAFQEEDKSNMPKDSPQSKKMMIEKINEIFGIKGLEEVFGKKEKNKSKEVVELYQKLMEHFYDTLEIGEDGEIVPSDIVHELDEAYRENDLIALLNIETDSFDLDSDYLSKQEDEKLKWLIVSLRLYIDGMEEIIQEMEEDSMDYYVYI